MTFKEFTKAIKKDPRLMELLDRCDRTSPAQLTDEETQELVDRTAAACGDFDLFDDDDWY